MKTSAPRHAQNSEKKQYVLSQPCLHQLVKGRLLPQDGSESFGVTCHARWRPFQTWEHRMQARERYDARQIELGLHRGVRCPFPDTSMAEHTVANTWTVKKNFPRVFCLPYLLTFCLACVCVQTWRTASGADCIRSSRYGVLVQAWPTASGARDIVFGPRLGPLHPELAEEKAKRRRMRRRSNNKRKKKKKDELHLCQNLETLT